MRVIDRHTASADNDAGIDNSDDISRLTLNFDPGKSAVNRSTGLILDVSLTHEYAKEIRPRNRAGIDKLVVAYAIGKKNDAVATRYLRTGGIGDGAVNNRYSITGEAASGN
jgi:hypothetical protein